LRTSSIQSSRLPKLGHTYESEHADCCGKLSKRDLPRPNYVHFDIRAEPTKIRFLILPISVTKRIKPDSNTVHFDLVALLEYPSPEEDTYFQPNDTYVSRWPELNQIVQWGFWQNESTVVDGVDLYIFSAVSQDGCFTIRAHISPEPLSVGQGIFGPNDIKIDFEIHNFSFVENNTRLALQTLLQSQTQSQNDGQNAIDNNNLLLSNNVPNFPLGSFSWTPEANGNDSSIIRVVASTAQRSYGNQFDLYFSFLTELQNIHSDVVWDPRIGLAYTAAEPISTPAQFCFILCGTMAIVLVAVVAAVVIIVFGSVVWCLVGRQARADSYQRID